MREKIVFGWPTLIERLVYLVLGGALCITSAISVLSFPELAFADHANGPHPEANHKPLVCSRVFVGAKLIKENPCNPDWWNQVYYRNVDNLGVLNTQVCTGAGRGVGQQIERCWLYEENAPHRAANDMAGEAVACWD